MTKMNCSCGKPKDDCLPFRKIVIPAVMGDDSEDSPSAPENGAYCNALVEYEANGAMYIYASDGIYTKISMVAGGTGAASITYVDSQDARVLSEAKAYTDEHSGQGGVSQQYVDDRDTAILTEAKTYADNIGANTLNSAKTYADGEAETALSDAKDYADGVGASTLASANAAISAAITQANVPAFTLSTSDIGEGSPLAANNFYGVYE
jgi:hypothetical protein